ncbi:MAG: hypothetical protein ACTSUC_15025 [Promethearchaeota archaeon]
MVLQDHRWLLLLPLFAIVWRFVSLFGRDLIVGMLLAGTPRGTIAAARSFGWLNSPNSSVRGLP